MALLKVKDILKMNSADREKKLKELKLELVKSKVSATKTGNSKARDIRKMIARIITINTSDKKEMLKNK